MSSLSLAPGWYPSLILANAWLWKGLGRPGIMVHVGSLLKQVDPDCWMQRSPPMLPTTGLPETCHQTPTLQARTGGPWGIWPVQEENAEDIDSPGSYQTNDHQVQLTVKLIQQIPSKDLFSFFLLIMSSQPKIPKHLRKASYIQKKIKENNYNA